MSQTTLTNGITGLLPKHPRKWLWLEVEHRFARLQIDRHRSLHVHDQPRAVDLAEASGPTQPVTDLLPIVHGCAQPVEAVGECHVIAHRDGQVSNFIVDRTRERRERLFPMFPVCIRSHVLQRGHDVERHEFGRVHGHNPIEVLRTNRLPPALYDPCRFGLIVFLVFFDCHHFLLLLSRFINAWVADTAVKAGERLLFTYLRVPFFLLFPNENRECYPWRHTTCYRHNLWHTIPTSP